MQYVGSFATPGVVSCQDPGPRPGCAPPVARSAGRVPRRRQGLPVDGGGRATLQSPDRKQRRDRRRHIGRNPQRIIMLSGPGGHEAGASETRPDRFVALYLPESDASPKIPIKTLLVPACEFVPGRVVTILSTTQEVVIRLKRPLEQQAEFIWTSFEPLDRADSAAQQRDDHWIDERSGGGRTQAGRPRARRARVAHRELLVDRDVACANVTETRAVTSRVARRCRRVFGCNPCGRHGAHRPLTRSFA